MTELSKQIYKAYDIHTWINWYKDITKTYHNSVVCIYIEMRSNGTFCSVYVDNGRSSS